MFWNRKPPQRGQVRFCADPRGWSNGVGGEHRVVLLQQLRSGCWRCAVIESNHSRPVYEFSARAAKHAGVRDGSTIGLPVAEVPADRLGTRVGFVSATTCNEIESALTAAQVEPQDSR